MNEATTKPNKLRSMRKILGFSQQELMIAARVSIATLTAIERYGYVPGPKVREKLAQAMGLPVTKIFPNVDQ
jgi:transcriptional regulator with XRE-family HTH domain